MIISEETPFQNTPFSHPKWLPRRPRATSIRNLMRKALCIVEVRCRLVKTSSSDAHLRAILRAVMWCDNFHLLLCFWIGIGKPHTWEIAQREKSPKGVRRGGVFWTQRARRLSHQCKVGVTPMQKRSWVVQKTLGRPLLPGSQRPFVPSPSFC